MGGINAIMVGLNAQSVSAQIFFGASNFSQTASSSIGSVLSSVPGGIQAPPQSQQPQQSQRSSRGLQRPLVFRRQQSRRTDGSVDRAEISNEALAKNRSRAREMKDSNRSGTLGSGVSSALGSSRSQQSPKPLSSSILSMRQISQSLLA